MQVPTALWVRLAERQATPEISTGADRSTAAVWELAPSEAVTVTL